MQTGITAWLRAGDLPGQCVALAGLFQAVTQVQACARHGVPDDEGSLRTSLESVLRLDAPDPPGVFGGIRSLTTGLNTLHLHLQRQMNAARLEQSSYAASLMFLQQRLGNAPAAESELGDALHELGADVATHGADSPWMQRQLADIYVRHVSNLGPRIMVSGEPAHLKDEDNANRIRSLLLAGLRAAVLWRQCGGSRLKLMLHRTALDLEAGRLIQGARADDDSG